MQRILKDTVATISGTFYVDGVATDPSPATATVTVTRDDGTVLVNGATATRASVGKFTLTLNAAQTALLDQLTATWTSSLGTITTEAEVTGGFLFSLASLKTDVAATGKSTDQLLAARTYAETALEGACGRAFVPRYHREQVNGSGGRDLVLSMPFVRAVRWARLDGVALTVGELADLEAQEFGVYNTASWTYATYRNYEIAYEHGPDAATPEASRAALLLARAYLGSFNRPIDDRAITFNTTEGGTYSLAVPGRNGSIFGIPDVDAFVQRHDMNVGVA